MDHTKWRDNFREVIPNRAIAYSFSDGAFQQEMPFENIHGHGGLLTTTADLIRWNLLLENHQIGGDPVFRLRVQKGKLNNGQEISYSSGLTIEKLNGQQAISHSGATAGYRAWLAYYPQKNLSIAILSNDGRLSPANLGRQIAEIFLGHEKENPSAPKAITLSEAELKKYEGIYKSLRGFDVLTLDLKEGKIVSNQHALIPIHKDTLYLDGLKWIWKKPNQIVLQNRTDTMTYVRKNQPQLSPTFLKAVEGDYYSEEADVTFSVHAKEDLHEVWIHRKPSTTFKVNASYLDGFLSEDLDLYEFKRDRQGKVSGFEVSMPRAERIIFTKVEKKK